MTLTSGGSLRTRVMDEGATVEYKAADGEKVTVETGEMRGRGEGGGKVGEPSGVSRRFSVLSTDA